MAFFSAGKLKRVDVSGGSPIVLCDAADADVMTSGGSWNRDGVIIFGSPQGMYRVSASGGVPALVAPINGFAGETGYGLGRRRPRISGRCHSEATVSRFPSCRLWPSSHSVPLAVVTNWVTDVAGR